MPTERVFVDTNVLLSGLIFRGNEALLLRLAMDGRIRLVLAEAVLDEARRVLFIKFPNHVSVLDELIGLLEFDLVPWPAPDAVAQASVLVRDPGDAVIAASILTCRADVAVTGDKDLLTPEARSALSTSTCAEYLGRAETTPC